MTARELNSIQRDCTGSVVPDSVVELVGYRTFGIDFKGRLCALRYPQYWTPGENVAKCLKGKSAENSLSDTGKHPALNRMTAPHPSCSCGFYSFWYTGSVMFNGTYKWSSEAAWPGMSTVDGIVSCYGKVLIGTKGMRAQKGRVIALSVRNVRPEVQQNCKSLYPDIKFYDTVHTMLEAHPTYVPSVEVEGEALWEWDR